MSDRFYLRSVHKRWHRVLAQTQAQAFVCSPYLTPKLALNVIQSVPPQRCVVYTRFSIEDFASGASSLAVVESLVAQGYPVLEIPALHAKILLVRGEFASIGSQNLTGRGTRNREATFCTDDPDEVADIEESMSPWVVGATRITVEMVEDAKRLLGPIEAQFRQLQHAAAQAEAALRAAQAGRDEAARVARAARESALQHEAKLRSDAALARHVAASAVRNLIEHRLPDGQVPLLVAKTFIRRATWWNTHRSGPVFAEAFAERITGSGSDWRVRFGANTFLVGAAILKCHELLKQYVDAYETGIPADPGQAVTTMRIAIRCSVIGYNGRDLGCYPIKGDDMHFGAHSVDMRLFIKTLLDHVPPAIAAPLHVANESAPPVR